MFGRKISWFRATVAACVSVFVLSASSCPPEPDAPAPETPAPETRIQILQLNMRGVLDVPFGEVDGFWETRFARIGAGLKEMIAIPDVIALQEVTARVWCPDNYNLILDYEVLHRLIRELQSGTGVRYQIAYFQIFTRERHMGGGASINSGNAHQCRASSGLAMLYNPNRLTNLSAASSQAVVDSSALSNTDSETASVRRSMPCCLGRVRPGTGTVCSQIDGPPQTNVCDSPSGLAVQANAIVAVARFSLSLRADNTTFHVYNVHMPGKEPGETPARAAVRSVITTSEPAGLARWIPPIFVGDFNLPVADVLGYLTDFTFTAEPPKDGAIHVFQGNAASFPSVSAITRSESIELPAGTTEGGCVDRGKMWSDHCGLLTSFWVR